MLMEDPVWAHRILYILNDAFYKGTLPDLLEKGVTVLIPKVSAPAAQLVLRRTQHLLTPVCRLQYQVVLPRASISGDAVGHPVRSCEWRTLLSREGGRHQGLRHHITNQHEPPDRGPGRRTRAPVGGEVVGIVNQSNGVRQGGPDSPVAFSALVGREVQKTTREVKTSPRGPKNTRPPTWTTSTCGARTRSTSSTSSTGWR